MRERVDESGYEREGRRERRKSRRERVDERVDERDGSDEREYTISRVVYTSEYARHSLS